MRVTPYEQLVTVDHVESRDVAIDGCTMRLTIEKCRNCGKTHEHVYGAYDLCPFCGSRLVAKETR